MKKILFLTLSSLFLSSCINNVEDQVPEIPDEPISYATQVQPIFNSTCGGGFCHTNGDNVNGVNLDSYQNTINSEGLNYGSLIVVPNDAANSPLVDKLGSNPDEGKRMPQGRPALSNSEIGTIIAWINQGAQDN
jgi:hypothetical protein